MTEQTTTDQTSSGAPELSGVDLARLALQQARLAAKNNGGEARAPRPRRATAVKRDGREPSGFAAVLAGLMADRAWELPAAGGSILDRWPDIAAAVAPQLPRHVTAVAFHPENGQLDLRPDSPAYATQLRLITARIVATVNSTVGTEIVRTIRVLAVGAASGLRVTEAGPQTAPAPQAPVKTREMACPGYHQALATHQAARPEQQRVDPAIAAAIESQTRALRELSRRDFPDPDPADQPSPMEAARAQRRRQADVSHAAALRRARAERAAREAGTAAVLPQQARLQESA